MAVYEGSESEVKALAKVAAAIKVPSAKVRSEVEYFVSALAEIGIEFESLSALEIVACQDALFRTWQGTSDRRAERDAEKAESDARAAKARLEKLDAEAERDAKAERENTRKAERLAERKAEREALREKFSG